MPWPEWENVQKTMPKFFLLLFSKYVAFKIDWFQIFLDRPSNLAVAQITTQAHCQSFEVSKTDHFASVAP